MGCGESQYNHNPSRTVPGRPRPEGSKIRLCCAGFTTSHHTGKARQIIDKIGEVHGSEYDTWFFWAPGKKYYEFVDEVKKELPADQQERFGTRKGWSSPFVWLEMPDDGSRHALGGRDGLCEWVFLTFTADCDKDIIALAKEKPRIREAFFSKEPGTAEGQDVTQISEA
uniref:Uncharacterized protein n=1 Tax=Noctiluca scintillans TaxID=2966 RepID=A0A7S0ZXQ6_NOCSC